MYERGLAPGECSRVLACATFILCALIRIIITTTFCEFRSMSGMDTTPAIEGGSGTAQNVDLMSVDGALLLMPVFCSFV